MKVWLNGRLRDEKNAYLSVFDHGFLYGDGLYETVRIDDEIIFLWREHYARFKRAARSLHFNFPWTVAQLEKIVHSVARANQRSQATVRITLSRGAGTLGLDPASCKRPTLLVQLHPDHDLDSLRRTGVSVGIVNILRAGVEASTPVVKTTSAQNFVLACLEAKRQGFFEGLLLNAEGELTEGTISNIFFVREGRLHTPALACGILAGITRAHVVRLARRRGIAVIEGRYQPEVLFSADELFLTNTSFQLMPVKSLRYGKRKKVFAPPTKASVLTRLQEEW